MPKNQKLINLLPQEEFEASITGRVLRWTMTTFRYIVIVTEIIVMGAFLSRFWLDAQNADLNDTLDIKTAQIKAQADFEKQFRDLQARLAISSDMEKDGRPTDIIGIIVSKMPGEITLNAISYQDGKASINGTASTELSIAQFIANLKADKTFKSVSLGQVTSSQSNQADTVFSVDLEY